MKRLQEYGREVYCSVNRLIRGTNIGGQAEREVYGRESAEERYRLEIGYEALGSLGRSLYHWRRASESTAAAALVTVVVVAALVTVVAVAAVSLTLLKTF